VVSVEVGQQVHEIEGRARDHHSHRDVAADQTAELIDGEPSAGRRPDGFSRINEHGGPCLGQSHRPRGPIQQFLTELSLELADLGADARLGHVEPSRGPRETRFFRDGHEVLELPEFHKQTF
jgi:hypothetical protein